MFVEKVTYQEDKPLAQYHMAKVSVEMNLNETDDPDEAFDYARNVARVALEKAELAEAKSKEFDHENLQI